jgi:hypothetical protein
MQGKENPAAVQEAVKSFLGLVKGAGEMSIDRYCLTYIQYGVLPLFVVYASGIKIDLYIHPPILTFAS